MELPKCPCFEKTLKFGLEMAMRVASHTVDHHVRVCNNESACLASFRFMTLCAISVLLDNLAFVEADVDAKAMAAEEAMSFGEICWAKEKETLLSDIDQMRNMIRATAVSIQ